MGARSKRERLEPGVLVLLDARREARLARRAAKSGLTLADLARVYIAEGLTFSFERERAEALLEIAAFLRTGFLRLIDDRYGADEMVRVARRTSERAAQRARGITNRSAGA